MTSASYIMIPIRRSGEVRKPITGTETVSPPVRWKDPWHHPINEVSDEK
jgi:hypothetical protein